jgi:hypothetical protein
LKGSDKSLFVKNASSLNKNNIISVNDNLKDYLVNLGYSLLSKDNDKWIFAKTKEILDVVKDYMNGGET